ncbi:MAG: DMT family transporter [Myxococcota bacterium]|nr:DMT family transporter [Myxococcota bacterium]
MESVGLGEFYSIACALIWSGATVLFRMSGEHVPPVALNLFKNSVALVLFLVTLPAIGVPLAPPDRPAEDWAVLLASGAVGIGIADSLFFAALNRLGAGGLAIVSSLYSPLVLGAAFLYLDEPVGPALIVAATLMVGAIVVGAWQAPGAATAADRRRIASGVTLGTASIVLMAVAIVAAKPVLERSDPWWATTVRVVGGLAVLSIQALAPSRRSEVAAAFRPGRGWAVTIPASFLGAYVAMILWIAGMKEVYAGLASVLNQTSTLFTPVLGVIFLRERITTRKGLAIAMAFSGAAIAVL